MKSLIILRYVTQVKAFFRKFCSTKKTGRGVIDGKGEIEFTDLRSLHLDCDAVVSMYRKRSEYLLMFSQKRLQMIGH